MSEENTEGDVLHFFTTVFPTTYLPTIVHLTNRNMIKDAECSSNLLTQEELLRFFGILLLIPMMPDMDRRQMWSPVPMSKYTLACDLGRTGMSRHRFEQILRHICFSDQPKHRNAFVSDTAHRWRLVDDFIFAINTDRARRFWPGWIICINESMIR